jgi:DNA-binding transcriptional ArsR family regulator
MTRKTAVELLSALAQETRLGVLRLLIKQGSRGLPPGSIASKLKLSRTTLSFHLRTLSTAGLLKARRDGRFIYYSPDLDSLGALIKYLAPDRPYAAGEDSADALSLH